MEVTADARTDPCIWVGKPTHWFSHQVESFSLFLLGENTNMVGDLGWLLDGEQKNFAMSIEGLNLSADGT